MSNPEPDRRSGVYVDRLRLHDLVNHLTIALGHSDLLLLEMAPDAALRPSVSEIRNACRHAVDLVESWRVGLPPDNEG